MFLRRGYPKAIPVAIEEHSLAFAFSSFRGFNPVAHSGASPQRFQKPERASMCFRAIMFAHHIFDSLGCFVCMIEWDGADIMMSDMRLNNTMKKMTTDEAKFAIDGGSCATGEAPNLWLIMRESGIGMLKVCDSHKPVITQRYGNPYHTRRLSQPKFFPIKYKALPVMKSPRSLKTMSLTSLASYKGLHGLKWFTPPKTPLFLPMPRPSGCRS